MITAGKIKKVGIIDLETGQILEPITVYLLGKLKDKGFIKVYLAFTEAILEDKEIMRGPYRLLSFIMAKKLRPNSLEFYMSDNEACEALKISERTYRRWLSILTRKGYIKRIGVNLYRLRPYTAVIGTMTEIEDDF